MEKSRKRAPGGAKKEPRECLERLRGLWGGGSACAWEMYGVSRGQETWESCPHSQEF